MKVERRFIANELRVKKSDDGKAKIAGYATKFAPNAMSEDLGGFREQIHPNAFNKCLTANPDVRGLWNHDPNHILGRTTAGTLRLQVDNVGLQYEIDPPDTTVARDLMVSMERGDITQSSFGFVCINDDWRQDIDGTIVRTVLEAELFDVSPVTFPAYPDATSGVRSEVRNMSETSQAKLAELRASHKKTKKVDGVELHAESFAYVGDTNDPETWKLPIDFPGDEEKTKSHIRDALARFNQTEGIPEGEKAKVHERIVEAAKKHGIQVSEEKNAPVAGETRTPNDEQQEEARCDCRCTPCADGNCAACNNENCGDTRCVNCGARAARSLNDEQQEEKRCQCSCTPCVDGNCDECVEEQCDDEMCSACPMQEKRTAAAAERSAAELHLLRLRLKLAQLTQV